VKPGVKPDVKPDVTPDVKPDVTPGVKPDVGPDVKPDVKPDVSPVPERPWRERGACCWGCWLGCAWCGPWVACGERRETLGSPAPLACPVWTDAPVATGPLACLDIKERR